MARQTVTIVGLDDVLADIRSMAQHVQDAAVEAIDVEAEAMADDMRANVRVASGDLKRGIEVERADEFTRHVGVHKPGLYYVQYEEFGTSLQPGHPFMRPAAERSAQRAGDRVAEAIRRELG
ncbi:HK97-gp10 family putative phage morphogenesis protein [Nocardioides alkalitolerans]|uniref:HK97-gp10 family putative phage morphogenesis protein n=1 Tax=Nocardioides alkalitolerans TaxID=281714 RepID=UPI00048A6DA4|nr:HK97-gp10 family putative phage morphogenesis protein [Nocardioides alkalitolerans]